MKRTVRGGVPRVETLVVVAVVLQVKLGVCLQQRSPLGRFSQVVRRLLAKAIASCILRSLLLVEELLVLTVWRRLDDQGSPAGTSKP